tara:strand:- start:353 stop:958 length:606 start_codon:yes stop_codon:yes gene_type:complete
MSDSIDKIKIFDDIFSYQKKESIYETAIGSRYTIGFQDSSILEHGEKVFIYSRLDHEQPSIWEEEFLPFIKDIELIKLIDGRTPERIIINCTLHSDIYIPHTHYESDVFLYYINMEWKQEWWGETQFLSENVKDVIFTSPYVPGRVIWFDGILPHTIKTQSFAGPKYRFSLSVFFEKKRESTHNDLGQPYKKCKVDEVTMN